MLFFIRQSISALLTTARVTPMYELHSGFCCTLAAPPCALASQQYLLSPAQVNPELATESVADGERQNVILHPENRGVTRLLPLEVKTEETNVRN